MKVIFNVEALQEALKIVAAVSPAQSPKPILTCVSLTASLDNVVLLQATDLELAIERTVLQCEVKEPGKTIVPAAKLAAIVNACEAETIELAGKSDAEISLTAAKAKFSFYTYPTDQWPAVLFNSVAEKDMHEVSLAGLQEAIGRVIFATCKEPSRYALHGVWWEHKPLEITLAATDGRRLAVTSMATEKAPAKMAGKNAIVSIKTLAMVLKVHAEAETKVKVWFDTERFVAWTDEVRIYGNLVDGKFPKYDDIIPKTTEHRIKVSAKDMVHAVKQAQILSGDDRRTVTVKCIDSILTINASDAEVGSAEIEIDAETDETDPVGFEVIVNSQFLLDPLKHTVSADMEVNAPDEAVVIRSGEKTINVFMPITK